MNPSYKANFHAKHAIIIGIDGLGTAPLAKALQDGYAPTILELRRNGSYTDHSRATTPTMSLPNWAAILSGSSGVFTGIGNNGYKRYHTPGGIDGPCTYFPNLFTVLRNYEPEATTVALYTWPELSLILEPVGYLNITKNTKSDEQTVNEYIEILRSGVKPRLSFIYLVSVDNAGHSNGYGQNYMDTIRSVDEQISKIIQTTREVEMYPNTAFIVATDHGREKSGKHHGSFTLEELETQFIVSGEPSIIRNGLELTQPMTVEDTSPTVLSLLGVPNGPLQWRGRPVLQALNLGDNVTCHSPWIYKESLGRDQECLSRFPGSPPTQNSKGWWVLIGALSSLACLLILTASIFGVMKYIKRRRLRDLEAQETNAPLLGDNNTSHTDE